MNVRAVGAENAGKLLDRAMKPCELNDEYQRCD